MSETLYALTLAIGLLAMACSSQRAEGKQPPPAAPMAKVEVSPVRAGALSIERRLLGEVRSEAHAALAAGEEGEVLRVRVREGDHVKKGQVLVEIDPARARASLRAAVAQQRGLREQLQQARREAKRLEASGARLVPEIDIERALSRQEELAAQLAQLDAAAAEARTILSQLTVKAPFEGQVVVRAVDPGAWVHAGDPVLELVATDRFEVLVDATEDVVARVQVGDTAELRKGGEHDKAEVVGVVRALDSRTRTSTVRLAAEAKPTWLLPGGTVDVVFHIQLSHPGAIIVPRDALVSGAVDTRVVRVVDGKAQPLSVNVLQRAGEHALIEGDGLSPDDSVVTRGNERLSADQPVEML